MTNPMAPVRTVAELYPPSPEGDLRGLEAFLGASKEHGRVVLPRSIRPEEKQKLEDRRNVLGRWLLPGAANKIALMISKMLMGFGGGTVSESEAMALTVQYVDMVKDLPRFAVERACIRFATGQVRADEIGEKTLSLSWRPSTAQLYRVAADIARVTTDEYALVCGILAAKPPTAPQTPEERQKLNSSIDEWREQLAAKIVRDEEILDSKRREQALATMKRERENRIAEYRAAGVEPPPMGEVVISLALRLSLGWTIQEIGGQRVLVRPPPPPSERKRETRPDEMGR